jgi:hypothetical protein
MALQESCFVECIVSCPIDIIKGSILLVHHDMSTEGKGGKLNLEVDLK